MIRRIATATAAGALALGVLGVTGMGSAGAVVQITAGPGSHINCTTLSAKATLAPALTDAWVQSEHSSDTDAGFRAIPDNSSWVMNGPVSVSSKTKVSGCTGTVVQGSNSATVKKATLTLITDPAHPGLANPATCYALVNPAPPAPTDAQYIADVLWSSGTKGFTIAPSHATGVTLQPAGVGFAVGGGTISGSFAGGTSSTQANVDGKTAGAFVSSRFYTHLTSATAKSGGKPCQASAKNKKGVWSLKAPKGIAKIKIGDGSTQWDR